MLTRPLAPLCTHGALPVRATAVGLLMVLVCAPAACQREVGQPLPVLGRVADFALVNQAGAPVTRATLDGEPWVANFIFTRCASVCPLVTQRMRAIQALAQRHEDAIRLVSFSVDPEHDQPAVLKSYADTYGADQTNWMFLTGSDGAIAAIAQSFAVALDGEADPDRSDFGIMHSGHLVLVDGNGRIRGYYPSSEAGVEEKILVDLARLGVSPAQGATGR